MLSFWQFFEALNHQVEIVHIYSGEDFIDDEEDKLSHREMAQKVQEIANQVKIRFNWAKEVTIAALVDGEVAGGVASEMHEDGRYWTYDFDTVVSPKYQGPLMIGFRLIEAAIQDARHQEPQADIIRCYCVNPGLLQILINKYGFTTYDRRIRRKSHDGTIFKYFPRRS